MRRDLLEDAEALGCRVLVRSLPLAVRPGVLWSRKGRRFIFIHEALAERDKDHVLAHEVVHVLRGTSPDLGGDLWGPVVAREEGRVERSAARLLVPVEALADFCDRMADLGEGVGPAEVMAEFEVSRKIAETALDLLTEHERGTS